MARVVVTGRRNARLATVETIRRAHATSSAAPVGWQSSRRRRLGVSPDPATFCGPLTVTLASAGWFPLPRKRGLTNSSPSAGVCSM